MRDKCPQQTDVPPHIIEAREHSLERLPPISDRDIEKVLKRITALTWLDVIKEHDVLLSWMKVWATIYKVEIVAMHTKREGRAKRISKYINENHL